MTDIDALIAVLTPPDSAQPDARLDASSSILGESVRGESTPALSPDEPPESPALSPEASQKFGGGIPGNCNAMTTGTRRRNGNRRPLILLGQGPKRLRRAISDTRYQTGQLVRLLQEQQPGVELSPLQKTLCLSWSEAEITRRCVWQMWRDRTDLTVEQVLALRAAAEKATDRQAKILAQLGFDASEPDPWDAFHKMQRRKAIEKAAQAAEAGEEYHERTDHLDMDDAEGDSDDQ